MAINKFILVRILQKKHALEKLTQQDTDIFYGEFEAEFAYNTHALRGGTLTLREVKALLEEGRAIGGKDMGEYLDAMDLKKKMEFVRNIANKKQKIGKTELSELAKQKIQTLLLSELCLMLNTKSVQPIWTAAIIYLKALEAGGEFASLLANFYLMRNGYPPIVFLRAEKKKCQQAIAKALEGDSQPFIDFMAKAVERSLESRLKKLGGHDEGYLTLAEAAMESIYSQEYLSLLARKGRIGAVKFGRNWEITKRALDEYEGEHA